MHMYKYPKVKTCQLLGPEVLQKYGDKIPEYADVFCTFLGRLEDRLIPSLLGCFFIYFLFTHVYPGTMTTHAESINSDLQRGLDRHFTTHTTEHRTEPVSISGQLILPQR